MNSRICIAGRYTYGTYTARCCISFPEAAMSELAAMFDPPVTKSAMNHRMRKLPELAEDCGD